MRTEKLIGCSGLLLVLSLILTIVGMVQPVNGQEEVRHPLEITYVDTSAYPQVRVYVASPNGALPDPATITLRDRVDGEDRDISPGEDTMTIVSQRVGVAVVIAIDLSRSMRGRGMPGSLDRLEDAREQAIELALALDDDRDWVSLFVFNREPLMLLNMVPADGGKVANLMWNDELLNGIPDRPSEEDHHNDGYAHSAVSATLSEAVQILTAPTDPADDLLDRLPQMQKVVVLFSDSCDTHPEQMDEVQCTIPDEIRAQHPEIFVPGPVSVASVVVGTNDSSLAAPVPPRVAEDGVSYEAKFELLEHYATEIPGSRFFHLFVADAAEVEGKLNEFRDQVIGPIMQRGDQLVITYIATVAGQPHEVTIQSGDQQVSTTFDEPSVPPQIQNLVIQENIGVATISVEYVAAQSPVSQVRYFLNDDEEPIVMEEPPFDLVLDDATLSPGTHTVAIEVVDERGESSPRSQAIPINLTPRPTPAPTPMPAAPSGFATLEATVQENILALVAILLSVLAIISIIASPRGRRAAEQAGERVTHVLRLTRPMESMESETAIQADYLLVVREGAMSGIRYPLLDINTYIGSDPTLVDVVLSDIHVSGRHASINREGSNLSITDLASSNGTFVNNTQLAPNTRHPINPGDTIRMGNLLLELVQHRET